MFQGVVHANARKVLGSWVSALPSSVHVIGSGNFSIEATLRAGGYEGRITGCDVSLYTCALGAFLTEEELLLSLNREAFPELSPLERFFSSSLGRAAAVCVALDALPFHNGKNAWQRRKYAGHIQQLEELCAATMEKLRGKQTQLRLNEFFPLDGWDRLESIPRGNDEAIISFPPTYRRGYDRLYARLESAFRWSRPDFRPLRADEEFARMLVDRRGPWILGIEDAASNNRRSSRQLCGVLGRPVARAPRRSAVSIDLYSNLPEVQARLVRRRIPTEVVNRPRLRDQDPITADSVLGIAPISLPQANYLRQVYSSRAVPLVDAPFSFVVTVDGRIIGLLMFAPHVKVRAPADDLVSGEGLYLMSDLAVASRTDRRLAKLVLHAALSNELRDVLQEHLVRPVTWLSTTVFCRHPTSMKYRGLFRRFSKVQTADQRFKLQYFARFRNNTLREEFQQWWTRQHSRTT